MSVDISVIVPTRDRRVLLERKLDALHGAAASFEVVVVADACSDDTEAFLDAYAPAYPLRWTVGPGQHAATARNMGAALARGAVLLFSDDDVVAPAAWVDENLALHERPGQVGLSLQVLPPHLEHGDALAAVHGWWNTNGRSTSLRAELFERVGGYDGQFSTYGGEDPDLGYRLMRAGAAFRALRGVVVEHWDEGYLASYEAKAASAGRAHVAVWRKHADDRIAWALGIHPVVLAVKGVVLLPWLSRALGPQRLRWERAYAEGARAALRASPRRA